MTNGGKNNLILVGMPGAGKSTLGVLLAKALGKQFIDTDLLIQEREGALLQKIIDERGIDAFLRAEEQTLESLRAEDSVIATGGSAVYSESAMKHLREMGGVIYLEVSFDEIMRRLTNISTRGIAVKKGQDLRGIYEERVPLYKKYADITVECGDMERTVEMIIRALRQRQA